MKKEIGIDIDGCLNHYHDVLRKYIKQSYNVDVPASEYYVVDPLKLLPQEENNFWKHFDETAIGLKMETDSKKIIDKLSPLFKINIVTARHYISANSTEKWLSKYKIYYDNIYFNSGDKLDVCNWKNIKIMIEDNPDNTMILAKNGIKVLLFDRLYNQEANHENIIRCKNWNEIWSVISLLNLNEEKN